jgi:nucleotide-binding universal stress UspA family protein
MFKKVLLAVDLDEEASWRRALPAALEACRAESAVLHVLNVAPEVNAQISSFFPADANRKLLDATKGALHEFVTKHVPADIAAREIVVQGTIYKEILAVAQRVGADLIVMGARAPGVRDILLGANAAHVVRHARCSVLVVREGP